MNVLDRILDRARLSPQCIVLCEGEDLRVLQAAARADGDRTARIKMVGNRAAITALAAAHNVDLGQIELIEPGSSPLLPEITQALLELRHKRGMTQEQAGKAALEPLTFAALMVRLGHADGSVAGAAHTTADVVRNAIQLIGAKADAKLVSSFFIMLREEPFHATTNAMIFSDCGLVINPNEQELAEIALAAADSARRLLDTEPKVAMLSFSTHGSAHHHDVQKVSHATALVRERAPSLAIDGEVQLDAAIVPEIAARKIPDSRINGQANVLIFPNLDAANIGYKLTERLGHATAIGPLLQGLNKPANDLSRGCSANDVYNVIAVTSVQAQTANADGDR
ncbi:phosphate acetyltransferase [Paralcaligenes sp. KSB-10]|uniref:phosphate acetyltransferase n=1 Tax=Paralcaligenes sp. KSB-10 TaxID=2901142 RepID=UPI001E49D58A|nr:phosphate acetyltransferase [Paralcaligenes sp. KSB-10]UHL65942.1 phosphate acetyltransferase [Paralcaligenes sp. KSB-10]